MFINPLECKRNVILLGHQIADALEKINVLQIVTRLLSIWYHVLSMLVLRGPVRGFRYRAY